MRAAIKCATRVEVEAMTMPKVPHSFWLDRTKDGFTNVCVDEMPRMRQSPFSRIRLDLTGELAPPKRKTRTGRSFEELAGADA